MFCSLAKVKPARKEIIEILGKNDKSKENVAMKRCWFCDNPSGEIVEAANP